FGWGEGVAPVEVGVEIDGKTQQETLSAFVLNTGSRYRDHGKGEDVDPRHLVNILCSPGLGGALKENTFKADAGPDLRHFHEARLPVEGWSKDWLTYSRYNGLVVAGGEVEIAAAEVRSALFEYTQCGGVLMVVGPCKSLPPSWQRAKTQLQGLTAYFAGFGMCLVSEQGGVTDWGPGQARVLTSAWGQSGDPWRQPRSPSEANRDFPVVENIAVPVRGLFLSMVGFVLIIGPLNLYILGRKKRKLWMLWTVPAFSLATCAAVVLYMIASEGWHGHIRAEGLTFLDEESGRASTVGWIGFYTPMASGDGLRFSRVTELTPQLESPQRYGYYGDRSATSGRSIDWTDEQHLGAGWVTARVPLHFLLRKSEARKERLAVHKEGGALAVTNELGAGIRELWLADAQGRVYTGKDIALGGRSELTPAEKKLAGVNLSSLRQTYTANWLKAFEHDPLTYLRPGCYVAVLNSAPFIEDGLRTYQSRKGRSIVFGIMKEPGHAG
ncbi:MAG TPA: hypothetical protein VEL76_30700, partial [Gemmataceae bacterium]|nr:hypothetical protein [Gemmataceae bacterium]